MPERIVALSTCGSAEEAETVARALVERRIAACVNIVPQIHSVYRWKGAVEQAREWLLVIKTTRDRYGALEAALRELHSYEVPELVALPIVDGLEAYLTWLDECVASTSA